MSNERSIYDEPFFTNPDVPYCLKTGMVAILAGFISNINEKNEFMAQKILPDRTIAGAVSFTFGDSVSMGENNCIASLKTIQTEKVSKVLEGIVKNETKSDKEIVETLSEYVSNTCTLSLDGLKGYWNDILSVKFDEYMNYCKNNYNGLITDNLINNLRSICEETYGKKKQMTQEIQTAEMNA